MIIKRTRQFKTTLLVLMMAIGVPGLLWAQQKISIIPQPVSLVVGNGNFLIDGNTSLNYNTAQKDLAAAATFFSNYLKSISGYTLPLNAAKGKVIILKLAKLETIGNEGYKLSVTPSAITVSANSKAGIIYAMQSLFQTLPQVRTNAPLAVPYMEITDYPRFEWRGMHLDVSRHFFSADMVKEYINLMATYKMNTFHWHLVDDQGWRIEIKKYPKLTEIGAWRVDKLDKVWSDRPQAKEGEAATYGGYYTQQQIKEIIQYAADRAITIVPEIEMPGHVASAIAAYPFLSCEQQHQLPLTGGNYNNMASNYCPGNDSVFKFLENVLSEVIALFPSQYIHIGGDEVDKGPWKKCASCQARIKAEGLKNEDELQSYFIKRIEKFVVSKHRKIIGWDEILEGGLAPEAAVMSWRGESGGIEAAKMSHHVVMTPGSPLYFDHYQAGPEGEQTAIGGMNTLKKVYEYEPIPKELNEAQAKYVMGAQANLWTEYITTVEQVEYMVLPRMLALAEVVWSPKESRDWTGFSQRLKYQFRGFDQKGYHYSKGNFKVAVKPSSAGGKLSATLATEALNGEIYYTTDGTDPNTGSTKYTTPILIDSSINLKAVTVVDGQVMGMKPAQQSFSMHKAIGRAVQYANPYSRYYPADGPNTLTDGVRGTEAVGKYYHGFSGVDLVATIDLGVEKSISTITLGTLQQNRDWIFLPKWVKFEVSDDGKNFTEVGTITNTISPNEMTVKKDFTTTFIPRNSRYVRVTAKNGLAPAGHPGEGKPGWIFADEIVVN